MKRVSRREKAARSAAAALLGRAGGVKGGRARARSLTKARRTDIAAQGGEAFAALPMRRRRESALRGWETRRREAAGAA